MEISKENHRHFIIYKPYGYLSQFYTNAKKEQKKKFLGDLYKFPQNAMAIGRLDEKSEGLLLITTDGKTSDFINSQKVDKEYHVQVNGDITNTAIETLKAGVEIGFKGKKYSTQPCEAFKLQIHPEFPTRSRKIRDDRHGPTSWVSVILNEGKYRQVRKMTAAVGFPTLRLVRVRVGNIQLNEMEIGDVIEVANLNF
ncbi:MAG: pseudouridine synthase [Flavobacteriales bacterium]|nr:pseudouridine synthase [Flavobacteriia bacterium]NCP05078.1 pseudouridine synthase [Flavobacteriales bacterium]PIV92611.1 MAG: ribulose phosphate epimerase [Flavobacteriaceae bacterium CG17_big_fil_post_rev_8_21_14_2_50_33_15]PIY12965.1 MAG: ribulose phosphate epimerase [Flavobacteriaceae bacterium CG_4_10_14_3_um_filter_33_47]PJB20075.1 MAG: ribulose phosphate epimerase [Flavobacteriaceae bacterium CG_4_9_14_3_um_filter_33_16]